MVRRNFMTVALASRLTHTIAASAKRVAAWNAAPVCNKISSHQWVVKGLGCQLSRVALHPAERAVSQARISVAPMSARATFVSSRPLP